MTVAALAVLAYAIDPDELADGIADALDLADLALDRIEATAAALDAAREEAANNADPTTDELADGIARPLALAKGNLADAITTLSDLGNLADGIRDALAARDPDALGNLADEIRAHGPASCRGTCNGYHAAPTDPDTGREVDA